MDIYELREGNSPLVISIPHTGTFVPDSIKELFTPEALRLPDTDWHVDRLYEDFVTAHNPTVVKANYSRYVIDLNRPPDDTPLYPGQTKIPLCPDKTFDGQGIYQNTPDMTGRLEKYWQPYHDELDKQIKRAIDQHGYALLYDAHSIRQSAPLLFEGKLPDLNLGTANNDSCNEKIAKTAFETAQKSSYNTVLNGRFIGGYITRHYGDPAGNVHALQMELTQKNYMDENSLIYDETKAGALKAVLEDILHAITDRARAGVKPEPV